MKFTRRKKSRSSKRNHSSSSRSSKSRSSSSRSSKKNTKMKKNYRTNNIGRGKETKKTTVTAKKEFPDYETYGSPSRHPRRNLPSFQERMKMSSISPDVEDYFLRGTSSSQSENEKKDIAKTIDNSGLPKKVQETIVKIINLDEINIEQLHDGIVHLKEINDSPSKEVYDDILSSPRSNYSFDDVIEWDNDSPSKPFEIDISIPEVITINDLDPDSSDSSNESLSQSEIDDRVGNMYKKKLFEQFGYTINAEEKILLTCLSSINYWELNELLSRCIKTQSLLQMDPIDVVVIVHGSSQPNEPKINMHDHPSITMNFLAPKSVVLELLGEENKHHGRRFESSLHEAFDKKMFVFDKHSIHKNPMCPALWMGISISDPQDMKDSMGIFVRTTDKTLFKITDFNCIFEYIKKKYGESNFNPLSSNMTLKYVFEYIEIITRLLKNIITKSSSKTPPHINVYQLSCRSYLNPDFITQEVENIWNALLPIGEPFNRVFFNGMTYRPYEFVSNSPTSIRTSSSKSSSALSENEDMDEAKRQQYVIENIKRFAEQLAILKSSNSAKETINKEKRRIFKNIIKNYRKLSFEFAENELPVHPKASIICYIEEEKVKWDDDDDPTWIE